MDLNQMETQIKTQEQELKAKKLLLKQLKKEANKKPFGKTKFGKAYFGTLKFVSKPFAAMHQYSTNAMDNPMANVAPKLMEEAEKFHAECVLKSDTDEDANQYAVDAAKMVIRIEDTMDKFKSDNNNEFHEQLELMAAHLDSEVQRLRNKDQKQNPFGDLMDQLSMEVPNAV